MKVTGIHDRQGYVEIRVEGPFDTRDLPEFAEAVKQAGRRKDGGRILANALKMTARTLSTLERYQVAMAANELPPTARLAMLGQSHLIEPEKFGEKVARNRGHEVRVFDDEAIALSWLLEQGPPPFNPEGT